MSFFSFGERGGLAVCWYGLLTHITKDNFTFLFFAGKRSLASCLGGGDLDGLVLAVLSPPYIKWVPYSDTYSVIMHEPLLPTQMETPASYDPLEPRKLPPGQSIEEAVCDFIEEYIHSDVLVSQQLVSRCALG